MTQHIHHWVGSLWRVRARTTISSLLALLIGLSGCGVTSGAAAQAPAGTATATIDIPARDATAAAAATAVQRRVETAAARPSATSISVFTPYPTPEPVQFEPGIYEDCESARIVMTTSNCWADRLDNQIIGARAGALLAEPAQGVLAVATWNLNMTDSSGAEYHETPQPAGAVRIVQAHLPYLTVEAADGTQFTFNVTTRQWEVLQPTVTPTPLPSPTPTVIPSPTPAITTAAVRPVLECVVANGSGAYTAYFGYKNDNTGTVAIPVGTNNRFSPTPQGRGQPVAFLPGRQQRSFAVAFNGSSLVWTLKGPDGQGRTATASSGSGRCTTP